MHTRVLIVAALVVAAAAAAATPVPHADTALSPLAFLLPAPPLAARPAGARALPARRARAPHETQHYETQHYLKHPLWPTASVRVPALKASAGPVVEIEKSILFIEAL
jgi:hypothetical protein